MLIAIAIIYAIISIIVAIIDIIRICRQEEKICDVYIGNLDHYDIKPIIGLHNVIFFPSILIITWLVE